MAKKTVKLNTVGIQGLPNSKPVVYKIFDKQGENIYTGVAKKGNVHQRLKDHLPGHRDAVPGAAKVQIEQQPTIREAEQKEGTIISRSKPKYNQEGK
jgi:excinuclease UvrABC nuclease subunit